MRPEEHLALHARLTPQKTAVEQGGECMTYARLYELVCREAEQTARLGRRAIVFRSPLSADFIIRYLAIHMAGCVAVPLESDAPEETFGKVERLTQSNPIPEEVYDILFTTGTTGEPKGVMISDRAVVANTENLVEAQKFSQDLTFLLCGPLNHIGSLSKISPVIAQGGTLSITSGLRDINGFYDAMARAHEKVASFLVPANIRLLMTLSRERLRHFASKIDFIETGAAPMPQTDMEELCRLLPGSRLYNTYASTETGIIATHDYNNDLCRAGCLGRPMKNSSVSISPAGTIVCSGGTLMSGYIGDEAATGEILHDGAVFTHDIGRLDEAGRIRLEGRDGDVINIGGYKIAPSEVEDAAMSVEGVTDCICIPAIHPTRGETLKLLLVVSEPGKPSFKEVIAVLKTKLERYKLPQMYEYATHIERTYNGKLNRKAYARR